MARFQVVIKPSAVKELAAIHQQYAMRISIAIEALAINPYPPGSKKLQAKANKWRIGVGDYRVVYSVFQQELRVFVVRIAHRKDVYS